MEWKGALSCRTASEPPSLLCAFDFPWLFAAGDAGGGARLSGPGAVVSPRSQFRFPPCDKSRRTQPAALRVLISYPRSTTQLDVATCYNRTTANRVGSSVSLGETAQMFGAPGTRSGATTGSGREKGAQEV